MAHLLPTVRYLLLGAGVTVLLASAVIAVSTVIGLVLALGRLYGWSPIRSLIAAYVVIVRGVPLLILLIGFYFSLPYLGVDLPLSIVAVIVMGLYFGAYMAEVFRTAIGSVPRTQWDAGRGVGFRRLQIFRIVIIPQARRLCVVPFLNVALIIVKNTSLVSAIGGWELVAAGRDIGERTGDVLPVYLAIAGVYFVICFSMARFADYLEGGLTLHDDVPLVVIDQVSKSYGPNQVLHGVSLTVRAGEVVTLVGPSGCGKTTLLRCVNHLETYDTGLITVGGESVGVRIGADGKRRRRSDREIAAMRAGVGMVFQSYNLFPHLTVLDNVTVAPIKVSGARPKDARVKAMALLERVGLADKASRYPEALSGGQQQRVAIARALAMEPRLILLDEVTSALDPELVGEVLEVIQALAADGMTMIIVTHEMQFAREVSNTVVFLADGRAVESGSPAEVFGRPQHERLRAFLSRYHAAYRL